MNIFQKGRTNINLYRAREKGFFEACLYFKVKTPDKLDPLYINFPPKLDQYDIWSVLCIENDLKLKPNDRWKKCNECNYYYPDRVRYFGSNKKENNNQSLNMIINEMVSLENVFNVASNMGLAYNNDNIKTIKD